MEDMGITEQERNCLPNEESPLLRYKEFLVLRKPLHFHQVVGKMKDGHDAHCVDEELYSPSNDGPEYAPMCAALGNHVMRTGKHYATFKQIGTVIMFGGSMVSVGVIRPVDLDKKGMDTFQPWDEKHYPTMAAENRTAGWGKDGNVDYAVYNTNGGLCFFGYWDNPSPTEEEETRREWPGKEHSPCSVEVGLLLDLDEGTLTVFKNGRRLGVMMEGLKGEYSWFVQVKGSGVRIKRASIPSKEEQAAAEKAHIDGDEQPGADGVPDCVIS